MDPVKIIIFVAAFVLLLLLGHKLSGAGEIRIPAPPQPTEPVSTSVPHEAAQEDDESGPRARAPAAIGSDIPFPVAVPPITRDRDGRYNRPEFLDYHFGTIDVVAGPTDPTCFYDELFIDTRDFDEGYAWTTKFTVATPTGVQRVMNGEGLRSLYLDSDTIIVLRWDLEAIIGTAVQEIIKVYRNPGDPEPGPQESDPR